jgi:hypothetical protein
MTRSTSARALAEDHGLGCVVDDQVDAGRLLQRPDVATLAADDAALHLVRWKVDHADGVLGRVVGGDSLHGGEDDVASAILGFLARGALDGTRQLDGVMLRLYPNGFEQHRLGLVGTEPRYALEGDDLLLGRASEILLGLVELALAVDQLPITLLEHLRPLVELLVALREATLL